MTEQIQRRAPIDGNWVRDVVVMILLGAALGLAFNWRGLAARPSWGVAWVGKDLAAEMVSLDDLTAAADTPRIDTDDPMAIAGGGAADGLPEIPDLDRPIEVQRDAVKRFWDVRAALLIDAREPDEYAEGHIPGAINLPYDIAVGDPDGLMRLDSGGRPMIVYCGGGDCELSMSLAWELIANGQTKVMVYTGGYPEWVEAGHETATGEAG
jgi:3-mercaptopyruvate sulfurtransferase SseA